MLRLRLRLRPRSIVLITGAPCLGKTTIARKVVADLEGDYLLAETDIVRQLLRSERSEMYERMLTYGRSAEERLQLKKQLEIDVLNAGLSSMTYTQLEKQTEAMTGSLHNLINFAHRKGRSILIERVNLTLGALFRNKNLVDLVKKGSVCVINLGTLNEEFYRLRYGCRHNIAGAVDAKFQNYYALNREMVFGVEFWQNRLPNISNIEVENLDIDAVLGIVVERIQKICQW